MSRADADTEAVDDTTDDEHGNVLRGADNNATNNPDDSSGLDGSLACKCEHRLESNRMSQFSELILTTEAIREVARAKSSKPGTSGHSGSDATLDVGSGTEALASSIETLLVEVALVWLEVVSIRSSKMIVTEPRHKPE